MEVKGIASDGRSGRTVHRESSHRSRFPFLRTNPRSYHGSIPQSPGNGVDFGNPLSPWIAWQETELCSRRIDLARGPDSRQIPLPNRPSHGTKFRHTHGRCWRLNEEQQETRIAVLTSQVDDLWKWRGAFLSDLNGRLKEVEKAIQTTLMGRPSWGVSILLTLLSSALVGTVVALLLGK